MPFSLFDERIELIPPKAGRIVDQVILRPRIPAGFVGIPGFPPGAVVESSDLRVAYLWDGVLVPCDVEVRWRDDQSA